MLPGFNGLASISKTFIPKMNWNKFRRMRLWVEQAWGRWAGVWLSAKPNSAYQSVCKCWLLMGWIDIAIWLAEVVLRHPFSMKLEWQVGGRVFNGCLALDRDAVQPVLRGFYLVHLCL